MIFDFTYLYRRNFASFIDFAFRELHPGRSMEHSWYIQLLADSLDFTWTSKSPDLDRKLIFNLPPNSLKTHICSVALPAWILAKDPKKSVIIISETPDHAYEIRERCAELIGSRRFRALFPYVRISRNRRRLELTNGGEILHAGAGCSLPSRRCDLVVIDNPQSLHSLGRFDAKSYLEIDRTLKNADEGMIVIATRRLAEADLSGFLGGLEGWRTCALPAISMSENTIDFPPNVSFCWVKGWRLQEGRGDWQAFEKKLLAIGGEAFGWQYMQGLYQPKAGGNRPSRVDEYGTPWEFVGTFDPTRIALMDVRKWRADFLGVDSL